MNTSINRSIIILVLLLLGGFLLFGFLNNSQTVPKESSISEISTLANDGKVKAIHVDNDQVIADLTDGQQLKAYKEAGVGLNDYGIVSSKVSIDVKNPSSGALLSSILSFLLPFLLIAVLLWFMLRQAQAGNMRAMSFGKTQARLFTGKQKITFDDVAGAKEAKQELVEIVDFLKNPDKYKSIGAEIPKGVLLVGAPGVGKTLLAKAVAGEANVPFFSLSASEFVEMFVGVGAARVRDLFAKAKRNAPALIFIDELDAIGRQRGTGMGGGHDEREQTLNQILVEMDGFETDARVIMMAATNRPDVLDPALLRPGRFDRRVMLDLPDRGEREEIIRLHCKGRSVAKDINFDRIAGATPGASGADLKNIVNESTITAAREGRKHATQQDFDTSIEKVLIGPERKNRLMNQQEKEVAGYHEVGHALVGHFLPNNDPIHKISLVSRGSALGYTWSLPDEDRRLVTKSKFEDEIALLLGGREAEKLIFNETTTGAENDLKKATRIARDMVKVYGMSEKLGPIQFGQREDMHEYQNYSETIAAQVDEEVKRIVLEAEEISRTLLKKHKALLETITKKLMEQETIERDEFEKLVGKATA
jgi:cell division protease FtsH